ncbi:UNVERIFIED_CONTAM: Thiol-disulfide oxidoreductase LTO1 [Sesamum calycinum]|uniref:Thiol-disulfide oxidoreductase LTO1 n=2 Tax=Sesamum TaxID=4181 RepID=A0AAW2MPR8_9LAMI
MMMATTTSCFTLSLSSLPSYRTPLLHPPPRFPVPSHSKKGVWGRGLVVLKVNCVSERSKGSAQSESETTSLSPSCLESSSSSTFIEEDERSISAYKWCAALGGIGFAETGYLTYLKLTDTDAFCPMGGGSCTTILNSDYSSILGAPLPLFGMLAYGLVAILGLKLQLSRRKMAFDSEKTDGEMILTGITTSMAVASAYFLYILSTEFVGESCFYCLASAALSFSLFFITLKNFGLEKIKKMLGPHICIASLVVIALSSSYNAFPPVSPSLAVTEIPYVETEITKESSPLALSLAKHLRSIGAKLYGAFWCSHCVDQKQMFGREAAKLLDYVECYPDGVREWTQMAKACYDIELKGFPTWEINGQAKITPITGCERREALPGAC